MSKRVSSLFHGRMGGGLLAACLLALVALFGSPSSAAAAPVVELVTVYWTKGTTSGYEIEAKVTTETLAESVKLSGPNIIETELVPAGDSEGLVFRGFAAASATPTVGDDYTLTVSYGEGGLATETVTAEITGVLGSTNAPGLTAPLGTLTSTANPTFHWTAPASSPAGFSGYLVSVSGPDSYTWRSAKVASNVTSTVYNGEALVSGARYDWAAGAVDSRGNRAESRNFFVPGANFGGRVTDLNGTPLAGIEVQAATVAGVDVGPPVLTGLDGTYLYAGLPPGEYKIHFDFQAYYWKNRLDPALAEKLTVAAGAFTSNVNAVIRGWGAIAGSVYFTGAKPAAAQVTLMALSNGVLVPVASVPAVSIPIPASGFENFYMALIRPGTYYLRYSAPGYTPVDKEVVVVQNRTLQSGEGTWHVFNTPTSSLTVVTSGAGTVTSAPVGISCTSGSTAGCSSSYAPGTVVTLTATPTAATSFGGWSGACTGTGNCVVTVDSAKSVTATFATRPVTVRIDGNSTGYFSINAALDALSSVATLQTVRAKAQTFVENVLMVKPGVQVVVKGGYTDTGDAFTTRTTTSRTTIDGSLKVRSGKLIADRLVIK